MIDEREIVLIHPKDFERIFIDKLEEDYLPIKLKRMSEESYLFLKDLEEIFYPKIEDLLIFLEGPLGFLQIRDIKAKTDGFRSTVLYLMSQLVPMVNIYLLVRKSDKTKKRIEYLLEKHKATIISAEAGPNKDFLKTKEIRKRDPLDSRLRHEVFKRDEYKCKECGANNKDSILHVDHINPVSQGGTDELSNLQTLCQKCNLAKSNKKFSGGSQSG